MLIYILEVFQNLFLSMDKVMGSFLIYMEFLILFLIIFIEFNPLFLSIFLMMFTILISLNFSLLMSVSFYSFVLFMSVIGGLMIVFMYFSSLSNFEKPYVFLGISKYFLLIFVLLIFICFGFHYDYGLSFDLFGLDDLNLSVLLNLEDLIYYYPESKFLILMISYLFLALLCLVKICNVKSAPLRKFSFKSN